MQTHLILSHHQVVNSIRRLAYEIYERNYEAQQIVLAGIKNRGVLLSQLLHKELVSIALDKKVDLLEVNINKEQPEDEVLIEGNSTYDAETVVILVDDVLYTGRTLVYAMLPFLKQKVAKLQILVLVHRDYLKFPVKPDFVGTSLSTTMIEHVRVEIENTPYQVWLE